jgi:hypothetical protein
MDSGSSCCSETAALPGPLPELARFILRSCFDRDGDFPATLCGRIFSPTQCVKFGSWLGDREDSSRADRRQANRE